jgi:tetratricopeptide (TPR) repeat protein
MKIFVTYSWIDEKPDDNALKLVYALIKKGYDVVCDVLLRQKETAINFNKMMAEHLQKSDKVIVVLSEKYKEKADSFEGGVGVEYKYILRDIEEKTQKYILVTFDDNRDKVTPDSLLGRDTLILDKTKIISDDLLCKINDISQKIDIVSRRMEKGDFPIINIQHAENPYFIGRTEILDLIYNNFQNGDDVAQVQLLRGLGGVGKTSIALKYVYTHQDEYEVVWWVNAETSDSVLSSYKNFLLEQEIISENNDATFIIRAMELWFMRNKKWLFIYDNADAVDIDGGWLEKYLPKKRNGHVLITTRSWYSHIGEVINITVFTETEAMSFLEKRIRKKGNGYSDDSAKELAELLQYLPLALEQAAAYIREVPGVIYHDYIKLFKQYGIKVFNADTRLVGYNSTVTITWKISMAKITNESTIQMFNMCAYLAPDSIPVEVFIRGKEILPEPLQRGINDHLQRDAILTDLVRYSLLEPKRDESVPGDEKRLFYMHRLLQEVVRENFGKDSKWLAHCLNLIFKIFNWKSSGKELMNSFKLESPHAVIVAEKSSEVFAEDNERLYNISEIFFGLSTIHAKMLSLDSAKSYIDKCIGIVEQLYNKAVIAGNSLFMAYANRGLIYANTLVYNEAIEDFNKSIAIGEQMRIESKPLAENELAKIYMNRGTAYECMKLHDKALSDKNKSIDIYESMYKTGTLDDESELALAYVNRGVTYESMIKYNESLSDIDKAIEIWEKLKKEGKKINEDELAKAYLNRNVINAKVVLKKNEKRLSNDSALIYDRNSSNAQLNYQKKQHNGGNR